ncbi:MAG: HAD-IIB family hydrolase [Bdellovibrionales bacterium]
MKTLKEFHNPGVQYLFTDIDDTLTDEGRLGAEAYEALWKLEKAGVSVIPVTGRPAGWCEMIARVWPVIGVVGENGGLYYRYHQKKMIRHYAIAEQQLTENRNKLDQIVAPEILKTVKGSALASDQFCRLFDLAIDFCEDVPALPNTDVDKIVSLFTKYGAQAKVSSIHVNGWFGAYDKLSMCKEFVSRELNLNLDLPKDRLQFAFCGDSPNDEPMFEFFENSFAVANIHSFKNRIKTLPQYVSKTEGGHGFVEISKVLLSLRQ